MMYKNDSYRCGSHVISARSLFSMLPIKYVCNIGIVSTKKRRCALFSKLWDLNLSDPSH